MQSVDAIKIALRVLVAVNEKRHPDPADIEALRHYARPKSDQMEPDELACHVVQTALQHRSRLRSAGGPTGQPESR